MPLVISVVNLTIRPDRPTSMTYGLTPSPIRRCRSADRANRSFFMFGTSSFGLKLSICMDT